MIRFLIKKIIYISSLLLECTIISWTLILPDLLIWGFFGGETLLDFCFKVHSNFSAVYYMAFCKYKGKWHIADLGDGQDRSLWGLDSSSFVSEESEVFKKNPSLCHSECLPPCCLQGKMKHLHEVKMFAFPGPSPTGCLYLSVRQAGLWLKREHLNGGGGLRPYSQMGLGSLAPAARGCGPSYCGMELLLPIGMKQSHILKWSHNFKLFWVKRSFSQWSPWFIPLGWIT